jgi:hypothetical protein
MMRRTRSAPARCSPGATKAPTSRSGRSPRRSWPGGDPLAGHTAHLIGTATRDAETIAFDALLDVDAGTQVVGAVFQHDLDGQTTGTIELELLPVDPFEADTAFDGIEFADLALTDDVALVRPGDDAHNRMRRALATHDHWAAVLR